jgi:hypothetical protein
MGCCCSCLDGDEYVLLDYPVGRTIEHGPGISCFCCWVRATKNKFPRLTNEEYLQVTHMERNADGNVLEFIAGPQLYKPDDAYAIISKTFRKIRLQYNDYVITKDINGNIGVVEGPTLYCPHPYEEVSEIQKKKNLSATQYIIVTFTTTGERRVVHGPLLYSPRPLEHMSEILDMIVLNNTDYIYVTDTTTGIIRMEHGPKTFCPGAYDIMSEVSQKIVLKNNQYAKIMDNNTGIIRVERGPVTIIPTNYERILGGIEISPEINDVRAVYVFDTKTGIYDLVENPGMFVPSPTQEIIEVRDKIRLEKNECMIIIDKTGKYIPMYGGRDTSAFFLPPYCKILEQDWTIGSVQRKVSKFDLRPQYMDFEFLIRTCDNVELYLKLNFYWQVINVEKMISATHNAPQDVCLHAQSEILSEISRINMKEFMESFNEIIHKAIATDEDNFYDDRGVKLIRVEITGRRCKDPDTEKNFQEIIKKKTDRIKNLEQQHGQNEVRLEEISGQIEQEKLTAKLVEVKNTYLRNEQSKMGESDGARIKNFIEQLPEELTIEQKVGIYYDYQNTGRVKELTTMKNLTLYLTPKDLDIQMVNLNHNEKKVSPALLNQI